MAMASTTSSISISIRVPKSVSITAPTRSLPFRISCLHSDQTEKSSLSLPKTVSVATGTIIATLVSSPWAMAAKQIAESPQEDNRGLALLLPLVPALGWVLFNILQPALNQINKMRSEKAIIFGLGGLGLAAYGGLSAPVANAVSEVVESEGGGGNSGLLPYIVAGAVAFEVILLSTMQSKYEEKKE